MTALCGRIGTKGRQRRTALLLLGALGLGGCAAKRAYNNGVKRAKDEQYAQAILCYKKPIAKAPNLALAHYNMGVCYQNLQLFDNAVRAYEEAIDSRPDMLEAYWNLALLLGKMERFGEANERWRQALHHCESGRDAERINLHIKANEEKQQASQEGGTGTQEGGE